MVHRCLSSRILTSTRCIEWPAASRKTFMSRRIDDDSAVDLTISSGQHCFISIEKGHQAMRSLDSSLVRRFATFGLAILVTVAIHQVAVAQSGTWTDADGDGNWSDPANWTGGTIADGSGNTANFTIDANPAVVNTNFPGFYRNAINVDTARTIGNMV